MPAPAPPARPVKKVGLWKPPARQMTAVRSLAPAATADTPASLSARLLPEHFADPALATLFARARGRVLVAEGDSWFDYPAPFRIDLLDELDTLGREVVSLAFRGDTVENMVYGTEGADGRVVDPDLVKLVRLVTELQPPAVLFSGGGNDVAGPEFASFLNHTAAGRCGRTTSGSSCTSTSGTSTSGRRRPSGTPARRSSSSPTGTPTRCPVGWGWGTCSAGST